jgi:Transglycosylase-like domain
VKPHRLIATALSFLVLSPAVQAQATPGGETVKEVVSRSAFTVQTAGSPVAHSALGLRQSSVPRAHAYATEEFWDKLAQCETAQDWRNTGQWAGGLGIYTKSKFPKGNMGTWERYGGEQFAPSPDKATREQQIIVANRISVEGYKQMVHRDPDWARRQGVPATYLWDQKPVGFGGWGCYKSKSTGKYRMSKPKMYYYENYEEVVFFSFKFNERSKAVHDLQVLLNIKVDSHYGPKTKKAHLTYLKKKKLPLDGVPGVARVSAMGVSKMSSNKEEVKKCPKWEAMLKEYNLPVKEFSYVMWRESRCQARVIGWNYRKGMSHRDCKLAPAKVYRKCPAVRSYDSGLLQINSSWVTVTAQVCKSKWGDMSVLLKPKCNLAVARHLYKNGGMEHWKATSGRFTQDKR